MTGYSANRPASGAPARFGSCGFVVKADIPLAGRALEQGAVALGPTGKPFTRDSIGMALAMRELNQHLRETGESRGLNAGFTAKDRSTFLQVLDELVGRGEAVAAATETGRRSR